MPREEKTCPTCGQVHRPIFSDAVLEIYDRIRKTESDERTKLMYSLVEAFIIDQSPIDMETDEGMHNLIGDVHRARFDYEQTMMRLARLLVRSVPFYRHVHSAQEATTEVKVESKAN